MIPAPPCIVQPFANGAFVVQPLRFFPVQHVPGGRQYVSRVAVRP